MSLNAFCGPGTVPGSEESLPSDAHTQSTEQCGDTEETCTKKKCKRDGNSAEKHGEAPGSLTEETPLDLLLGGGDRQEKVGEKASDLRKWCDPLG